MSWDCAVAANILAVDGFSDSQPQSPSRLFHHRDVRSGYRVERHGGQIPSIDEAFARVERGQCWLYNAHINPYEFGNRNNVDPLRPRRLLLHKKEIDRLAGQLNSQGMAIIPLKIYFTKRYAKSNSALARASPKWTSARR